MRRIRETLRLHLQAGLSRWGRGEEDTWAHRRGLPGPAYLSSTRATAVGRVRCAAARGCGGTARLESGGATSARLSGRSVRQLVTGQTERRFDSDCFGVGLRALWIKVLDAQPPDVRPVPSFASAIHRRPY